QPLGHCWDGHKKRPRDLVRFQATKRAQGQGYLGLERERRVAAGEDQPKPVVGNYLGVIVRFLNSPDQSRVDVGLEFFLKAGAAPDAVYGLVLGRLDDPGARDIGYA